jgi:ankyrin repeat protein
MYIAAERGHAAVIKALLEAGVDANKTSNAGCMPLQVAVHRGHLAVVKVLLEAGAERCQ